MSKLTGSKAMKANGKTQVSIYLYPEEVRAVDRLAKKNRLSRAGVVREIVLSSLKKDK